DKSITEGQNLVFTVSAVDVDGDSLSFSAEGLPSGAVFDAATATFSWKPGYLQSGEYYATFTVSDSSLTDGETIMITVLEAGNQPPVLEEIGEKNVYEEEKIEFEITATDPDNSFEELVFSAEGLPTGAVFDPATRKFSWTPVREQIGAHKVSFSVSDGALSDSEEVTINVLETPYESIFMRSIKMDDYVKAGDELSIMLIMKNDGTKDMRNVQISIVIPELGLERSIGPYILKQGKDMSKTIVLEIPEDTLPGEYDVRITANTDEERRVKHRPITVTE
ncbi:MAG: putative Ig domain-containing protein, partial [Candidatus Woesearchaeota archaeon]|nr:putative Ig domain-containing protein [Candidatus Woesearchaeota archaeon]